MASLYAISKGPNICLRVDKDWYAYDPEGTILGNGAMGTVFIGRSCTNLSIRVAIKRVAPQYENIQSIRQRAILEGSLRFGHPNLIRMIGCCEYDPINKKGPIWIISHLVQGINLDDHVVNLKRSKRPIQNIVETIFPVLDALDYLHSKNIVHLDIKPKNIMFENGRNIRLMDLGIASVGRDGSPQTAGIYGTPQYAAPEQFIEDNNLNQSPINATTDIYQVGVTLYELLTQINPYDAPTIHQTMMMHRTVKLPTSKDVPKPLLKVLQKATEPEQCNRYQSALLMKKALKEALKEYELCWWKKIPWWVWTLVSIVSLVLLFLPIMIYGFN